MKKYLIILQQAPFANSQSLEAVELALALAAFAQPVTLLFMAEGVLQLLANQDAELIAQRSFTKAFTGLELFDISAVYADQDALQHYKLASTQLSINPAPISSAQIAELLAKHDIILSL